MKLKKVFSAVAAAAIAVSGLALGAVSAQAAETTATLGKTITLNAEQRERLDGHTFKAVKLADLKLDDNGYAYVETVGKDAAANTNEKKLYDAVMYAVNNGVGNIDENGAVADQDTSDRIAAFDPIAYISGVEPDGQINDPTQADDVKPWEGSDRQFVEDLIGKGINANFALAAEPQSITNTTEVKNGAGEVTGYQRTLTFAAPGLYLIFDTTNPVTTTDNNDVDTDINAVPMMVPTLIQNAKNHYPNKDDGSEGDQWPANYGGQVEIKNETTTVTKTANGKENIDAGVGETVHYVFDAPLPTTTGFDSANPYSFFLTDTPSKGQTVKLDTVKVFVDKDGNRAYDAKKDILLTQYLTTATGDAVKDYTLTKGAAKANATNVEDTDKNSTTDTDLVADGTTQFFVDLSAYVSTEAYQNAWKELNGKGIKVAVAYDAVITQNAAAPAAANGTTVDNKVEVNAQGATSQDSTTIRLFDFGFAKTNKDGSGLNGAEFKIYKGANADPKKATALKFVAKSITAGKDNGGKYELAENQDAKEGVVDTVKSYYAGLRNGEVQIQGLAAGDYTVVETKAPAGYSQQLLAKFTVTVINEDANGNSQLDNGEDQYGDTNNNGIVDVDDDKKADGKLSQGLVKFTDNTLFDSLSVGGIWTNNNGAYLQQVANYKNISQLPLTGAAGIAMFTVVGLLLAGAGVTVYLKSRSTRRALRV